MAAQQGMDGQRPTGPTGRGCVDLDVLDEVIRLSAATDGRTIIA